MLDSVARRPAIAAVLFAASASGATAAVAQAPPPTPQLVMTAVAGKAPTLSLTSLRPGPTELVMTASGKAQRALVVARLKPGVTPAKMRALTAGRLSERAIDRLGKVHSTFVAQGTAASGRAGYRTTVDLTPGTYVVADIASDKRAPQRSFVVGGTPNGVTLPPPDATIDMKDYSFDTGTATLPATGAVRLRNRGKQLHFTLAFPAATTTSANRLATLLRRGREKQAERLVAGPPSEPTGLISPGAEVTTRVRFRPGNYVLVCFYGSPASQGKQHNRLGMVRRVRVG